MKEINEQGFRNVFLGAKDAKSLEKGLKNAADDVIKNSANSPILGKTKTGANTHTVITNSDELVKAMKNGMLPKEFAKLELRFLKSKSTPSNIIDAIVLDLNKNKEFIKEFKNLKPSEIKKRLISQGYSDDAVTSIINSLKGKKSLLADAIKTTKSGKPKTLKPTTPGAPTTKIPNAISEKIKKMVLSGWTWKKIVGVISGMGISVASLWWFFHDTDGVVPDDMPEMEPVSADPNNPVTVTTTEWSPCIQTLIDNKTGIQTTKKDAVVVKVTGNPEYDKMGGLVFFNSGKVAMVTGGKTGTWECSGNKPVLNEQSSDDEKIMNTIWTGAYNGGLGGTDEEKITSAILSIKNVEQFNSVNDSLLKKSKLDIVGTINDEFGDTDAKYVQQISDHLTKLGFKVESGIEDVIQGKSDTINKLFTGEFKILETSNSNTSKIGDIKITWGKGKSTITRKRKSKYHNCNTFPFTFGCRSPYIKEMQKCLGFELRLQTGNFGPITLNALDGVKTITKEMYDETLANCKGSEMDKMEPITPSSPSPELKPSSVVTTNESPEELYNRLIKDNLLKTRFDGKIVYKGNPLSEDDKMKLGQHLMTMGYVPSKEKLNVNDNEKYIYKKNN